MHVDCLEVKSHEVWGLLSFFALYTHTEYVKITYN